MYKNLLTAAKTAEMVKNGIDKFKMTTQEDAFRRALLKITRDSELNQYFVNSINKILIDEFFKIVNKLGEYSIQYKELLEKLKTNGIMDIVDRGNNLYSELFNRETIGGMQMDKLINDTYVNDFLNSLMILYTPIIREKFTKILKTIGKYKVLKNAVDNTINELTIKLNNDEDENVIRKVFDKLEKIIENAEEQINELKSDYKKENMVRERNTLVENIMSGEEASVNAPNETNNISDDFYNFLLKISIKNKNIFSRQLDRKFLKIINNIIVQLNHVVKHKTIIEKYNGENGHQTEEKCLEEEEEEKMNFDKEHILKKYENTKLEKRIVEIIIKLIENAQNIEIDSQPFKQIVEYSFTTKIKQIEKIIIVCTEKNKTKEIQECIDDAKLLKNEITKYISENKKSFIIPLQNENTTKQLDSVLQGDATKQLESVLQGDVTKQLESVLQGDATKQLESLQGDATKQLESVLQGDVTKQLDSVLQGDVTKQLESVLQGDATKQLEGITGDATKQLESLQGDTTKQLEGITGDATKQLESLQGDATKQLGDATKQLGDATKQLGDATKQLESLQGNATKQLGSLTSEKGGKKKRKTTQKSSSRVSQKTRRRRQTSR